MLPAIPASSISEQDITFSPALLPGMAMTPSGLDTPFGQILQIFTSLSDTATGEELGESVATTSSSNDTKGALVSVEMGASVGDGISPQHARNSPVLVGQQSPVLVEQVSKALQAADSKSSKGRSCPDSGGTSTPSTFSAAHPQVSRAAAEK
mmetsp:Transcript_21524/g.45700  ORF Transcript_21524/g.45700 Transcript_21524/m.45700 type:complete len:152 (+) Transcript_21524:824-1279(+)